MEAAYRILAEQALELVARHALDSTYLYSSHASAPLLGLSPNELLGQRALALIDPEDREHARAMLDALISGACARVRFSARFRRQDGSPIWLDISAYPVRHEQEQTVIEYVTVAREAMSDSSRIHELRALEQRMSQFMTGNRAEVSTLGFENAHQLLGESDPKQPRLWPSSFQEFRAEPSTDRPLAAGRDKLLSGLTLLVVEDNVINQILARDLLECSGAEVALASDGLEAVRLANARSPGFDLILMDVQMPGMDGYATTRMMRGEPKTAHTPIIAMTAHAFDAERVKCIASGMNAHVAKPINPRELVQTVLTWARPDRETQPLGGASTPEPLAKTTMRDEPSFDPAALAVVFKDQARRLAFMRKFVDAAGVALDELDGYFRARDAQQVGFIGHKLKSSAKACGAHALSTTFAELEQHAKAPNWNEIEVLHRNAVRLWEEVVAHVELRETERGAS